MPFMWMMVTDGRQLLQHLIRRAPGHELSKVAGCAIQAVTSDVLVVDVAVEFVVFVGAEMRSRHLVVPYDGWCMLYCSSVGRVT